VWTGCLKKEREPFRPLRPWLGTDISEIARGRPAEPFPERALLEPRDETPPQTLARIEEVFRQIGSIREPEQEWRLAPVRAELDSIRAAWNRLDLGAGDLYRRRWGETRPEDRERVRRAAALQIRWGLALMRTGDVTQRVWGADRLEEAMRWAPGEPGPLLAYAAYLELGRFWSREIDLLESWLREHGPHDVVELQLLRKRERLYKVHREREELNRALEVAGRLAGRLGGWGSAPSWLLLERARLYLQADSLGRAAVEARRTIAAAEAGLGGTGARAYGTSASADAAPVPASAEPGPSRSPARIDTLSAAQAEILLGVLLVRQLEYETAREHLERGMALGAACRPLGGLVSWMQVPWDLFTPTERHEFDQHENRGAWLEAYWRRLDPILATPETHEVRIEYERRVGEAWLSLHGVDPALPGPLTDPGQALLRFGLPDEWTSGGAEARYGLERLGAGYRVQRTWRFRYDYPDRPASLPLWILFQDGGSECRFTAVDSMVPPRFPPYMFHYGFDGKAYRYETAVARLRHPDGRIRLLLVYDTYLPEYSFRFPLQGLRFEGDGRVRTALWRTRGRSWVVASQHETRLQSETVVPGDYTLRRRAGWSLIDGLDPGPMRLASRLVLRDRQERIVGYAAQNGQEEPLLKFSDRALDASDLVLVGSFGEEPPPAADVEPVPGWKIHGPELIASGLEPRAARLFLPGEKIAYYLEVYNLDVRDGVADVEVSTTLERLRDDGEPDYSVTTSGLSQSLIRYGVRQWNVLRDLGLTDLPTGLYRLRIGVFDRKASRTLERTAVFWVAQPQEIAALYRWDRLKAPDPAP